MPAWRRAGSQLADAAIAQESFYLDALTYTPNLSDLEYLGYQQSATDPASAVTVLTADAQSYCLMATMPERDLVMYYSSLTGVPNETPCG